MRSSILELSLRHMEDDPAHLKMSFLRNGGPTGTFFARLATAFRVGVVAPLVNSGKGEHADIGNGRQDLGGRLS
jgi:hypothetical protein